MASKEEHLANGFRARFGSAGLGVYCGSFGSFLAVDSQILRESFIFEVAPEESEAFLEHSFQHCASGIPVVKNDGFGFIGCDACHATDELLQSRGTSHRRCDEKGG